MTERPRAVEKAPSKGSTTAVGVILAVGSIVIAACLLLLAFRAMHGPFAVRWFDDWWDVSQYYERAQFYARGVLPYRKVFSEYPTIATLLFAVPMILVPAAKTNVATYAFVWQGLMAACWLAMLAFLARFRARRSLSPWPALVMLCPAFLYFSLMRFDLLCSLLVCASLAAFLRGRFVAAHLLLAVGVFVKWYPALLFPVYLSWHLFGSRQRSLRHPAIFVGAVALIAGATIWYCGWNGFLVPYRYHAGRGSQYFNLYWVLENSGISWSPEAWRAVGLAFFAAQFAILPLLLLRRVRTQEDVLRHAILAIACFVFFAKIYSPQWVLWIVPPALLFVRRPATIAALVVVGLLDYAMFPVAFDAWGPASFPFRALALATELALLVAVVLTLRETSMQEPEPSSEPEEEEARGRLSASTTATGLSRFRSASDSEARG